MLNLQKGEISQKINYNSNGITEHFYLLNNVNLQLGPNDYIYIKTWAVERKQGYKFSYEKFEGNKLKYKLLADNIRWSEADTSFILSNYQKRIINA